MIISASRRTDIPRFYFDWLLNRLHVGFVLVRNPMNAGQISRIRLAPDVVDCIVFWTKDPSPMLDRLDELAPYPFYVQFTLNPYGNEIECNLPSKQELLDTFLRLSEKIGPDRVVWRYSPVLYTRQDTPEYHLRRFEEFSAALCGHTRQCKLSFLDLYRKIARRMQAMGIRNGDARSNAALAKQFALVGKKYGIEVSACGNLDLTAAGLPPAKCIDDRLISNITGYALDLGKDPGQRDDCYCVASVDIGAYDTCQNGCQYCYANFSDEIVRRNVRACDPDSPLLCDSLRPGDRVTERKIRSNRVMQQSFFDPGQGQ